MPIRYLSTSKVAQLAGCHPNTVRLYEEWGLLQPVPRSRNGYRQYSAAHVSQMQLARTALHTEWPGKAIRRSSTALVKQAAGGDLGGALESAYRHLALVRAELAQAESAVQLLERWVKGAPTDATTELLQIKDAAKLLGLSVDILRNWERNGLVDAPRDPNNRYRLYGKTELARLRVIRMLRNAGYSPMAILRMLTQLDEGKPVDVRKALDTPREDEDVYTAADRWLTTLADQEQRALKMIAILEERIRNEGD